MNGPSPADALINAACAAIKECLARRAAGTAGDKINTLDVTVVLLVSGAWTIAVYQAGVEIAVIWSERGAIHERHAPALAFLQDEIAGAVLSVARQIRT